MPWTVTDPMTERPKFVLAHQEGLFSMSELCQRFNISRKTGYKWLKRYRSGGLEALRERSRAPKHCPHRTPEPIRKLVIEARRAHPRWGPRKLLDYLRPRHPGVAFPAPSTVGDILKREGLVKARRRKHRRRHPGTSPINATTPDQLWTADFKGEFRLGSGVYCYPLTVQDACSRMLLSCRGLPSTGHNGAKATFTSLFRAHGLPKAIRTDNGGPFASPAIAGLSRLSVWLIKLGIACERIQPGRPEQNGRHERMHRTLKAETTRPPEDSFADQQKRFDDFRNYYNEVRPHQALDGDVPAARYRSTSSTASKRALPKQLAPPSYPGHAEVRKVSSAGSIKFNAQPLFLTTVLAGEHVALEETDDGIWSVSFYDVLLGRLNESDFTFHTGTPY